MQAELTSLIFYFKQFPYLSPVASTSLQQFLTNHQFSKTGAAQNGAICSAVEITTRNLTLRTLYNNTRSTVHMYIT
jgi:hypothetical protein